MSRCGCDSTHLLHRNSWFYLRSSNYRKGPSVLVLLQFYFWYYMKLLPAPLLLIYYCSLGILLLYSISFFYFKATTTSPGSPCDEISTDEERIIFSADRKNFAKLCRKCNFLKPPRTHHCSICNRCILKMDHHCPVNKIEFHQSRF